MNWLRGLKDFFKMDLIRLKCFNEGHRLRVRIISPGYHPEANCQFPRAIRREGCEYMVPTSDVSFSETKCKFFYRIKPHNITTVTSTPIKIYGDDVSIDKECCICVTTIEENSSIVFIIFVPCGHYCCCQQCGKSLKTCPMCRQSIQQCVTREQLGID